MKKAILFAIFLSFSLLFFAKPAEAIYVKVTFTITSVTVPVRAVAAGTPLPPNTEMSISGANNPIMQIVKDGGEIVSQKNAPQSRLRRNNLGSIGANAGDWFIVFKNDGGSYVPTIKVNAWYSATSAIAYPDCSKTYTGANGYYVTIYLDATGTTNPPCPNPPGGGANMLVYPYQSLYFDFGSI